MFKTGQCSKNNNVQNITCPRGRRKSSRNFEETVGISYLGSYQHEGGVMHLSASHRPNGVSKRGVPRLPRSFPVGTTYVVEGRGGEAGHLQVFSRYVVLPDGKRINLGPDRLGFDALAADFAGRSAPRNRSLAGSEAQPRTGGKRRSRRLKKNLAAGGTRRRRRR